MDPATAAALGALIRRQRVAALATLRDGAPNVSLAAYLAAPDFQAFRIRISRLAWCTQDLRRDARFVAGLGRTHDLSPADLAAVARDGR